MDMLCCLLGGFFGLPLAGIAVVGAMALIHDELDRRHEREMAKIKETES